MTFHWVLSKVIGFTSKDHAHLRRAFPRSKVEGNLWFTCDSAPIQNRQLLPQPPDMGLMTYRIKWILVNLIKSMTSVVASWVNVNTPFLPYNEFLSRVLNTMTHMSSQILVYDRNFGDDYRVSSASVAYTISANLLTRTLTLNGINRASWALAQLIFSRTLSMNNIDEIVSEETSAVDAEVIEQLPGYNAMRNQLRGRIICWRFILDTRYMNIDDRIPLELPMALHDHFPFTTLMTHVEQFLNIVSDNGRIMSEYHFFPLRGINIDNSLQSYGLGAPQAGPSRRPPPPTIIARPPTAGGGLTRPPTAGGSSSSKKNSGDAPWLSKAHGMKMNKKKVFKKDAQYQRDREFEKRLKKEHIDNPILAAMIAPDFIKQIYQNHFVPFDITQRTFVNYMEMLNTVCRLYYRGLKIENDFGRLDGGYMIYDIWSMESFLQAYLSNLNSYMKNLSRITYIYSFPDHHDDICFPSEAAKALQTIMRNGFDVNAWCRTVSTREADIFKMAESYIIVKPNDSPCYCLFASVFDFLFQYGNMHIVL